jgi:hypothetical protein
MGKPIPIPIKINDAITWTEAWQKNNKTLAKAFLIPVDDLLVCFQEMGLKITTDAHGVISASPTVNKIRGYLALDGTTEKMLFVGTEKAGDIYEDIVEGRLLTSGRNPRIGSGVYDFTTPCPSDCDPKSSLFHK